MLNTNDLTLMGASPFGKKHHFVMRNGLFRELKCTISHPKMGLIGLRNGHFQKAKRVILDYVIGYNKRRLTPKGPL
jgi:hypothetical protein